MICLNCQNRFPSYKVINGKPRNLSNRKYCLDCSPFGIHNTKKLHISDRIPHSRRYSTLSLEKKKLLNQLTYEYQKNRRNKLKIDLVKSKGGKCENCGYYKNLAGLCFHHINPENKLFEINSRSLFSKSEEAISEEANKCKLLCLNCHAETHNPSLEQWQSIEIFSYKEISDKFRSK